MGKMTVASGLRSPRRLSVRDAFVLTASLALGTLVWGFERDWYFGALAAISLPIVVGLLMQAHDLWRSCRQSEGLSSEERWGWRSAVAWRVAVACLMAANLVVGLLVAWRVVIFTEGPELYFASSRLMSNAVLLIALIIAIGSSPRLARRAERRPLSWAIELLGCAAAVVLCAIIVMDELLITVLVHITIVGIQSAWPPSVSADVIARSDPVDTAWLFRVTTAGVVSILWNCGLVRLLSLAWWQGGRRRLYVGAALAASVASMVFLAGRIALVEIPYIAPILAANIPMPQPQQLAFGALLAILLVTTAARRWAEPSPTSRAAAGGSWHRDEGRYYHEWRLLVLLVVGVATALHIVLLLGSWGGWREMRWYLAGLLTNPVGTLSLALWILALQGVFSRAPKRANNASIDRPRLAPGLFLLVWSALLVIVIFGVPILAAWGFALCFRLG
jgi:hypothetical protein